MRLIIAVIQDQDAGDLLKILVESNYSATKLASTGGFLRQGNATILIGVNDMEIPRVMTLIEKSCHSRKQMIVPAVMNYTMNGHVPALPIEVAMGGASIFVMEVLEHTKL